MQRGALAWKRTVWMEIAGLELALRLSQALVRRQGYAELQSDTQRSESMDVAEGPNDQQISEATTRQHEDQPSKLLIERRRRRW